LFVDAADINDATRREMNLALPLCLIEIIQISSIQNKGASTSLGESVLELQLSHNGMARAVALTKVAPRAATPSKPELIQYLASYLSAEVSLSSSSNVAVLSSLTIAYAVLPSTPAAPLSFI